MGEVMQVINSGYSYPFEDLKSGALFAAGNKNFRTYFIKIQARDCVGAVCLKTSRHDQYSGQPGFFDYGNLTKEGCYLPNNVFFKVREDSLSIQRNEPYVGDAILIEDNFYLCARKSEEKIFVRLSDGAVLTLENSVPRTIFTNWSLVRKVGDVETTLLEYPGA